MRGKLTQRFCEGAKHPAQGEQVVRDGAVAGFVLRIGIRTKSFELRTERRVDGKRSSRTFPLGEHPHVTADDARGKAQDILGRINRGEPVTGTTSRGVTLADAWAKFEAALVARPASPKTLEGYALSFRHLKKLHDRTLRELSDDPSLVANEHARLTNDGHQVTANAAARFVRATYRHARKSVRGLPDDMPTSGINWNPEVARTAALSSPQLPNWYAQWREIRNPVQKELALFLLLSGLRRRDACSARWDELDLARRVLHRPRPKGREGKKPAFDLPLSRAMLRCLSRVRREGRALHPAQAAGWIFPGNAKSGHVMEIKSTKLTHRGHDLRRSYASLATEAGVPEEIISRLLNHSLGASVTKRYVVTSALLKFLIETQAKISAHIIESMVPVPAGRRGMT